MEDRDVRFWRTGIDRDSRLGLEMSRCCDRIRVKEDGLPKKCPKCPKKNAPSKKLAKDTPVSNNRISIVPITDTVKRIVFPVSVQNFSFGSSDQSFSDEVDMVNHMEVGKMLETA